MQIYAVFGVRNEGLLYFPFIQRWLFKDWSISILFCRALFFPQTPSFSDTHSQKRKNRAIDLSEKCGNELFDSFGQDKLLNGTLTPFWAQEMIGADLLRKDFGHIPVRRIPVAAIDASFDIENLNMHPITGIKHHPPSYKGWDDEHGTSVINLINGNEPVGIAYNVDLVALAHGDETLSKASLQLINLFNPPLFTNISYVLGNSRNIREGQKGHDECFQRLKQLSKITIPVIATGNEYPGFAPLNEMRAKNELGAILVGSLDPTGLISAFSQEGPHVLAPSGKLILSRTSEGFTSFGGTSAAAPLVTGSLALAMGHLPKLTVEETKVISKLLLEKTAVPLPSSTDSEKNGAGMLNTLKLVRTAMRLSQAGNAKDIIAMLESGKNLDFSLEAYFLLINGKRYLQNSDCKKKREGFDKIRRAFLLADPKTDSGKEVFEEAGKLLADIYRQMGLTTNAAFYKSLDKDNHLEFVKNIMSSSNTDFADSAIRSINSMINELSLTEVRELGQKIILAKPGHPLSYQLLGKVVEKDKVLGHNLLEYAFFHWKDSNDKSRIFRLFDKYGILSSDFLIKAFNLNGSTFSIAGVCNKEQNVFGLMPHPERASDLRSKDGIKIWESIKQTLQARSM